MSILIEKNIKLDSTASGRLNDLIKILSLNFDGKIILDFNKKTIEKTDLEYSWKSYLSKYECTAETDISKWSPHNNTYPIIQSNHILKSVVDNYLNSYNKYETVDMVDILDYYLSESDDYGFELSDYIAGKIEKIKDVDEALKFYMERNPYFKFDW